jgi:hypothetical protein
MSKSSRVTLHRSAEIAAPASAVWDLVSDWAGMLRWWPSAEQGGLAGPALVRCDLIGAHGAVPRTRRMTLANGAVVDEQILYQNDETRRIYYGKSATSEVTGYIASTYVDEIDAGRCALQVSSQFDVSPGAEVPAIVARFAAIYEQAIFNGFRRYFARAERGFAE